MDRQPKLFSTPPLRRASRARREQCRRPKVRIPQRHLFGTCPQCHSSGLPVVMVVSLLLLYFLALWVCVVSGAHVRVGFPSIEET
jgi:hypothetical protein